MTTVNADPQELAKFGELAHRWWDTESDFKPLHHINPLRLDWIDRRAPLHGKRVLDVGCGGGILAESMAQRGADVLGIDLPTKPLKVAQLHAIEAATPRPRVPRGRRRGAGRRDARRASTSSPAWRCSSTCPIRRRSSRPARGCVEAGRLGVLLHDQPQRQGVPVRDRRRRARAEAAAQGHARVRASSSGRASSRAGAARPALDAGATRGLEYNPLTRRYRLSGDTSVNYLVACRKPA